MFFIILPGIIEAGKHPAGTNAVLSKAIIRSLEIVGEASAKVDSDFKLEHPEVNGEKCRILIIG